MKRENRRELENKQPAIGWRSAVEKPPRQKTVLVFVPKSILGGSLVVRATWVKSMTLEADLDYIDEDDCDEDENGTFYIPGGWYEDPVYCETQNPIADEVTHWAELPPPPMSQRR